MTRINRWKDKHKSKHKIQNDIAHYVGLASGSRHLLEPITSITKPDFA
jgi:hypothetical protein